MKRSQIVYFILLGILLLGLIVFSIFLIYNSRNKMYEDKSKYIGIGDDESIRVYLEGCARNALLQTLRDFAMHGFYPNFSFDGIEVEHIETDLEDCN
ncbi:MAG: hypothetical protein QW524_02085, partial [Candidatus Woesearchaeota archaeon]